MRTRATGTCDCASKCLWHLPKILACAGARREAGEARQELGRFRDAAERAGEAAAAAAAALDRASAAEARAAALEQEVAEQQAASAAARELLERVRARWCCCCPGSRRTLSTPRSTMMIAFVSTWACASCNQ